MRAILKPKHLSFMQLWAQCSAPANMGPRSGNDLQRRVEARLGVDCHSLGPLVMPVESFTHWAVDCTCRCIDLSWFPSVSRNPSPFFWLGYIYLRNQNQLDLFLLCTCCRSFLHLSHGVAVQRFRAAMLTFQSLIPCKTVLSWMNLVSVWRLSRTCVLTDLTWSNDKNEDCNEVV